MLDTGAHRGDEAHALVAGNEGRVGLDRPVALGGVQVGVADAAGLDLDQHVTRTWARHWHFFDGQRLVEGAYDGGFAEYALGNADYVGHLPANVGFVEIAPVLCAGVTVYKGLKVTDTKPGDWVVISGIGGLGHMAVQYARAMGLNVAAVDVDDTKLRLAERLGATVTVNALNTDPAAFLKKEIGGAHGALVTAVSPKAFAQATGMLRRGGTMSLVGLPPGDFPLDIFGMVLNGITVRGSIVGSRLDLQESLAFAEQAKVAATVASDRLENINDIFARMHAGQIEGRIVLDMNA